MERTISAARFLMYNPTFRIELFTAWLWNAKHDFIRTHLPMCARGGGGQVWLGS